MCKLFIATGGLTEQEARNLVRASNDCFNRTEQDGFGFLACGATVARGLYEEPEKYPGFRKALPDWVIGKQHEEGEIDEEIHALIVHGRTSTNIRGLVGCHPFEYNDYYLAHNGMVRFTGKLEDVPPQGVDSDQFLHWLVDNGLNWDSAGIHWSGWGAIGLYDAKRRVLTVARDGASLFIARRVDEMGWVMATCKSHLEAICDYSGIILDTIPIEMPKRIVCFDNSGQMISERAWGGFGLRPMEADDYRARGVMVGGGKKNKKWRKIYGRGAAVEPTGVEHGPYKLPPPTIPATESKPSPLSYLCNGKELKCIDAGGYAG